MSKNRNTAQRAVIKATCAESGAVILIGSESIIDAKVITIQSKTPITCTQIKSRGAMVQTNYVIESPEELYEMIEGR